MLNCCRQQRAYPPTLATSDGAVTTSSVSDVWNSQDSVDTLSQRLVSGLELLRTHAAQMTMTARLIVERVDIIGDVGQRQRSVLVDLLSDPFLLQTTEEGLDHGIVPAVPLPTHARLQVVRAAKTPPRVAAELRPLIRMNHRAAGASPAQGHQYRVNHKLAVHGRPRRPTDDPAGEEVHDDGQVEPSLPRPNVREIGDPRLVGPRHRELPLQQIGDQDRGLADRPSSGAIAVERAQLVLAHEPRDAVLAAGLSRLTQVQEHTRGTVDALTRDERRPDQPEQPGVFLAAVRDRLQDPFGVAARRHAEYATHRLHAVPLSMGLDERVGRADPR